MKSFPLIIVLLATAIVAALIVTNWGNHDQPLPIQYAGTSTPSALTEATSSPSGVSEVRATTTTTTSAPNSKIVSKKAITTMFWVGEEADQDNSYISNSPSYWDDSWQEHFGGVDYPKCRSGYNPCGFTPKENTFYVALPYGEYDEEGNLKADAPKSFTFKNHWVEVVRGDKTCYGQWEDVGPIHEDDKAYVFGAAQTPLNTFDAKAGLDVSPALWQCLGLEDNGVTSWRFVDANEVPQGPWKTIVTTRGISWQ
ncbi:hypothetical protein KW798_00530 [Candidatus Parcubacteria bacterium]|nr:hypothetical protein [Candidatus Parcubacteria bacterium]